MWFSCYWFPECCCVFLFLKKLWRDTLCTGLRAKLHSEMTTAIALISTSSSGATGTGESSYTHRVCIVCSCFVNLHFFFFFMTSPFWPQTTISFSQYHNSHFCQPTLTTSSLAQATLTSHFHTVHLYIALFPHPPLPLEPFTACELYCFLEYPYCFWREAGKWVINPSHLLSWEPLDRNRPLWSDPEATEVHVCVCTWKCVCGSMLEMDA